MSAPTMSASAGAAPDRFASLAELQDRHAALVKEVGNELLAAGNPDRIAEFVRRGMATGAILDAKDDRAAAQALVNFWTSRLSSAVREAERTEAGRRLSEGSIREAY